MSTNGQKKGKRLYKGVKKITRHYLSFDVFLTEKVVTYENEFPRASS